MMSKMTNEKDPYNLVIDKSIMDAYLNGLPANNHLHQCVTLDGKCIKCGKVYK